MDKQLASDPIASDPIAEAQLAELQEEFARNMATGPICGVNKDIKTFSDSIKAVIANLNLDDKIDASKKNLGAELIKFVDMNDHTKNQIIAKDYRSDAELETKFNSIKNKIDDLNYKIENKYDKYIFIKFSEFIDSYREDDNEKTIKIFENVISNVLKELGESSMSGGVQNLKF